MAAVSPAAAGSRSATPSIDDSKVADHGASLEVAAIPELAGEALLAEDENTLLDNTPRPVTSKKELWCESHCVAGRARRPMPLSFDERVS